MKKGKRGREREGGKMRRERVRERGEKEPNIFN